MGKISLEPYLFFKGNCREAMEFYETVFGGELDINEADLDKMGDMPNKDWFKGKVMHASLKGPVNLMASDSKIASAKAAKIELSLGGSDEPAMRKIFDKLGSDGGKIEYPLTKEFWGDLFGRVTDKYGVQWIMNIGDDAQMNVK